MIRRTLFCGHYIIKRVKKGYPVFGETLFASNILVQQQVTGWELCFRWFIVDATPKIWILILHLFRLKQLIPKHHIYIWNHSNCYAWIKETLQLFKRSGLAVPVYRTASKHSRHTNVWSCVELSCNVRYLIRKQVYNCLALVNTGTSPFCMLFFWIKPQNNDAKRDYLNVKWSYGSDVRYHILAWWSTNRLGFYMIIVDVDVGD